MNTAARQIRHALTALTHTTPARRHTIAAAAADYLSQIDHHRLPVGYRAPITDERTNRIDAYRMRRGHQFARMLGLGVRPDDAHLPATARAVLDQLDAPVIRLTAAAETTGAPGVVALLHILTNA